MPVDASYIVARRVSKEKSQVPFVVETMTPPPESLLINIAGVFIALVICFIAYIKWKYTYYSRKGVYTPKPVFLFGNAKNIFTKRQALGKIWAEIYNDIKSKNLRHGGAYFLTTPTYVPVDLEIVKAIMQTDFQHFMGRGLYMNQHSDPTSVHVFNLTGDKWKKIRVTLTPTFTTGKMKMMFDTLANCAVGLKEILEEVCVKNEPLNIKDILQRFTIEIIGSCAFGIETNSIKDPNSEFARYGRWIFDRDIPLLIKNFLQFIVPYDTFAKFNLKMQKPEIVDFFTNLAKDTMTYREKNNIYRKDFLHLLLQLKNRGEVTDDDKLFNDNIKSETNFTTNELVAQVYAFFIAGYETSSTTMTFALLELSQNKDLQEKVRQEIKEVLAKHDNKLTFDAIKDMTYMEQVIEETLRKYPPVPLIPRLCNKDYKIPNSDVIIQKGEKVSISVYGIHHDPDIYPNPEKFDPERFSKENKAKRHLFSWLPFGAGPRICLGIRFGMMQTKVGLATILKDFEVSLNTKTKTPITFDQKSFLVLSVAGGVWVDVAKKS